MSRSRILLALLTMSLLASACVLEASEIEIRLCEDLTVGEQTMMTLNYIPGGIWERGHGSWRKHGPGTLEPSESGWDALYTATQAGTVSIMWEGSVKTKELMEGIGIPAYEVGELISSTWCDFQVFDVTVAPAEGIGYEVTAVVTVSTVEGVLPIGAESTASWRFVFDCPDGRCDAEVLDGGPYGALAPFMATYQADMENFVFDFVLDTPANLTCGDNRWVGEITPLGWDDEGPVGFTFTMVNVLTCDTGDIVVEWEGEGTRR
jgi:hypothetical protein